MSHETDPKGRKAPRAKADPKAERLKAALKANLQRRKAQSRARAADAAEGPRQDT